MPTSYLAALGETVAEIEVKRSRFRCTLVGVREEVEARAVVERVRKGDWDARHHCTAFRLGVTPVVERSSDDGEPAGTAGAPMLEVLRGRDISDTVAVVTRWFGGVLLGAGGLVRAYGDAVREAVDDAQFARRTLRHCFEIGLDHAEAGRVESAIRAAGVEVVDLGYADQVTLTVAIAEGETERLTALVAGLTAGGVTPEPAGERWVDLAPS